MHLDGGNSKDNLCGVVRKINFCLYSYSICMKQQWSYGVWKNWLNIFIVGKRNQLQNQGYLYFSIT